MSYTPTSWKTGDTVTATDLNKIQNGLSEVDGNVSTLSSSISEINNTTSTLSSSISEINNTTSTLSSSISSLNGNVSTLSSSISTLNSSVSTLNSSVSSLNSSVSTLNSSVSTLNSSVSSLSEYVDYDLIIAGIWGHDITYTQIIKGSILEAEQKLINDQPVKGVFIVNKDYSAPPISTSNTNKHRQFLPLIEFDGYYTFISFGGVTMPGMYASTLVPLGVCLNYNNETGSIVNISYQSPV